MLEQRKNPGSIEDRKECANCIKADFKLTHDTVVGMKSILYKIVLPVICLSSIVTMGSAFLERAADTRQDGLLYSLSASVASIGSVQEYVVENQRYVMQTQREVVKTQQALVLNHDVISSIDGKTAEIVQSQQAQTKIFKSIDEKM